MIGICLQLFSFNKVLIGHLGRKERLVPLDNVLENNFCAANPRYLQMDICFNLYRDSSEHDAWHNILNIIFRVFEVVISLSL